MDKYLLFAVYDLVANTEPTHYADTFFTRTWHYNYMGTQISLT